MHVLNISQNASYSIPRQIFFRAWFETKYTDHLGYRDRGPMDLIVRGQDENLGSGKMTGIDGESQPPHPAFRYGSPLRCA